MAPFVSDPLCPLHLRDRDCMPVLDCRYIQECPQEFKETILDKVTSIKWERDQDHRAVYGGAVKP